MVGKTLKWTGLVILTVALMWFTDVLREKYGMFTVEEPRKPGVDPSPIRVP